MAKKQKTDSKQIAAYLNLLGATATGLNPAKTTTDKNLNLIDTDTGEILVSFSVLNHDLKNQVQELFGAIETGTLPNDNSSDAIKSGNDFKPVNNPVQSESDGFESVNVRPIFPDFFKPVKNDSFIGYFLGSSRPHNSPTGEKTNWLFACCNIDGVPNRQYIEVSKWTTMESFDREPENGSYIYRLTYNGLIEREKNSSFHSIAIERKKVNSRPVFPIDLLTTTDYSS